MEREATRARNTSAARAYLSVWGPVLIVLGVGSLIVNPDFGVGDHVSHDRLFGRFETNGWHGLAGGLAGVAAVCSAATRLHVRAVAIGVALLGGIIPAAIFLASGDGSAALGIIPVDVADAITLHLVPGLVGLACVAIPDALTARRASGHVRARRRQGS